jgi:hypothetical protein
MSVSMCEAITQTRSLRASGARSWSSYTADVGVRCNTSTSFRPIVERNPVA